MSLKSALKSAAGAVALTGVAAGALVALAAPRRPSSDIEAKWNLLRRYRYAHRGLHDLEAGIPENSLAAFRAAREAGYACELDVHLTADGQLVVLHDATTDRVCGEPGNVEKMTLEQIAAYRLMGTDEPIPTFEQVLALFEGPDAPPLLVEIKTDVDSSAEEVCPRVMESLDAYNVRYMVEAFDPRVLIWFRMHRPEVVRGQLSMNFLEDPGSAYLGNPARIALTNLLSNPLTRPDFISYQQKDQDNPMFRLCCKLLGGHAMSWTVASKGEMVMSEAEGSPIIFEGFRPGPKSAL